MKKRVVVFLLVTVLALAAGAYILWKTPQGRKWRAERYARKAEALAQDGARDAARLACIHAIQLDPGNLHAIRTLVSVAPPTDLGETTFLRSRIADLDPSDADNLHQLAILAITTRRLALAAAAISSLDNLGKETDELVELRVRLALAAGQMGPAEAQAKLLLENAPSNPVGRLVMALSDIQNRRQDRLAHAEQQLRELAESKIVGLEAVRGLREAAIQREDLPLAIRYAEEIVTRPGRAISDYLSRAELITRQSPERLDEVLATLTSEAKDDIESLELISAWLQKGGHKNRVLTWLEEVPVFKTSSIRSDVLKFKILLDLGQWPELISGLSEADWEQMDFLRKAYLARAFAEQHEDLRASSQWRESVVLALKHPEASRTLIEITRPWPNWASKTEGLLWSISQQQPRNASWALTALSRSYEAERSAKSLLRVSRALADVEPANEKAQNNVAFFTLLTGVNVQQVEGALMSLYQKHPDDPVIASTYALLHLRKEQPAEALKVLEKLSPEMLSRNDIAIYYAVALHAVGRIDESKTVGAQVKTESLFSEELALLKPVLANE